MGKIKKIKETSSKTIQKVKLSGITKKYKSDKEKLVPGKCVKPLDTETTKKNKLEKVKALKKAISSTLLNNGSGDTNELLKDTPKKNIKISEKLKDAAKTIADGAKIENKITNFVSVKAKSLKNKANEIKTKNVKNIIKKTTDLIKKLDKTKTIENETEEPSDYVKYNKNYDKEINEYSKKYNIPIDLVEKSITNTIKLYKENPKNKNILFDEKFPLFLQINSWKIPRTNQKLIRIPLKHSLYDKNDEICLIVPDVKGIPLMEQDKHIEHYEAILKSKGVENISKILTLYQLKTEYGEYELKRGLVELYDGFLVEGKITGNAVHCLGKIFYKKRKLPTPVKLSRNDLKLNVEQALKKSLFQVHNKGDSFMLKIGNSKMDLKKLVENAFTAFDELNKEFPGGFKNFRSIFVFTQRATPIPVYVSTANINTIEVPVISRKRPLAFKEYEGELSTRLHAKVKVQPDGEVDVIQSGEESDF